MLALTPRFDELEVGVVAPYPPRLPEAFEARAFAPKDGREARTRSRAASTPRWPNGSSPRAARPRPTSPAGARPSRAGRVHIGQDVDGALWTGGGTVSCVRAELDL